MLTSASQFQHSQFSSQQNVSRMPLGNFGSTPHIPQYYQPQYQEQQQQPQPQYQAGYREIDASRQFYLHESPPPAPRRTWAQHAQAQQDTQAHELRGWQVGALCLTPLYYQERATMPVAAPGGLQEGSTCIAPGAVPACRVGGLL